MDRTVPFRCHGTQACLDTVMHRVHTTLSVLETWEAGTVVPIPREALSQVELRASDGRLVSRGRVGQMGGNRAVRIDTSLADDGAKPASGLDGAECGEFGRDGGFGVAQAFGWRLQRAGGG